MAVILYIRHCITQWKTVYCYSILQYNFHSIWLLFHNTDQTDKPRSYLLVNTTWLAPPFSFSFSLLLDSPTERSLWRSWCCVCPCLPPQSQCVEPRRSPWLLALNPWNTYTHTNDYWNCWAKWYRSALHSPTKQANNNKIWI